MLGHPYASGQRRDLDALQADPGICTRVDVGRY